MKNIVLALRISLAASNGGWSTAQGSRTGGQAPVRRCRPGVCGSLSGRYPAGVGNRRSDNALGAQVARAGTRTESRGRGLAKNSRSHKRLSRLFLLCRSRPFRWRHRHSRAANVFDYVTMTLILAITSQRTYSLLSRAWETRWQTPICGR